MKYTYWIGAIIVLGLGIYLSTAIQVHPETHTKVKFSQVSTPEEFGQTVLAQLNQEIKTAPVVLLGVTPNRIEDVELWRGFLNANQQPGMKYDVVIVEPNLPYVELFEASLRVDIKNEMGRFVEGLNKARAEGLRVAVVVPNIYSSQLLLKNPVARLISEFKLNVLSLTVSKFPVTREQEAAFEPACIIEEGKDREGTGPLGCAIQNMARKTYRQKLEPNKLSGMMDQVNPNDFLILFNRN